MADEFFLDDDIIISIDDDMIEEIVPDVSVNEERFKDDATLRLNIDQIHAELTSLILDRYKKSGILKSKVINYAELFRKFPEIPEVEFRQLKPIAFVDKLTYYSNEEDHIQNKEYEKTKYIQSDKLASFISQFSSLNRDKSKQSALQTTNTLYALYAPFTTRDETDVYAQSYIPPYNVDALRHCVLDDFECKNPDSKSHETIRLITKVEHKTQGEDLTLYDGDNVNVIGFYNMVDPNVEFKTFDIMKYITNVKALTEREVVTVIFNEPALDKTGETLIKSLKATVVNVSQKELTLELNKSVLFKNKLVSQITYSLDKLQQPFFIYNKNNEFMYTKQALITSNIVFRLPSPINGKMYTIEDVQSFIAPSSVGELIMQYESQFSNIYNLHDLTSIVLTPNNINLDHLSVEVHSLLMYVFASDKEDVKTVKLSPKKQNILPYHNTTPLTDFVKNAQYLENYTRDYPSYDSFIDDALNRFRYLRSQNDQGAFYVLSLLKHSIQKKYKKHIQSLGKYTKELQTANNELDKLDLPSKSESENSCEQRYAKEYKKLDKLVEDNGKEIYYDKKFDTTPYKLKEGFTGTTSKELRLYVLNELTSNNKFKKLSKSDIEFEVDSIVNGKRLVRSGDICILHTSHGDVVYTRQSVQDKQMWVKKFRTPYKICTDNPLVDFNDLVKVDSCIKQTFDDVCNTNKNARVLHKYRVLVTIKTELTSILSLLEHYDNVIELIDADIEHFRVTNNIVPSQHYPNRNLEYVEHVDYDEYHGNEAAVGDVDYQIDFNDQSNFVVAPTTYTWQPQSDIEKHENYEVLTMLLSFIQLSLDDKEVSFILSNISSQFPKQSISVTVEKFRAAEMERVHKEAYKTNEKYMKMYDAYVKQKVDKLEGELIKKYYFNVFRYAIALIIIVIFIRYPTYVMKRIHPSCVKVLAYMGHPVSEKDTQKSLVNYFACLITNISVSEDIRFAKFYELDAFGIQKVLKETIDEIINYNYELRVQLEMTKKIMASESQTTKKQKKEVENDYNQFSSFKPSFKFANTERMSKKNKIIIRFIKSIQDTIADSKILKTNGLNIPNLVNACCSETLIKDTDFYDFFTVSQEFKLAKASLENLEKTKFIDENFHPPQQTTKSSDLFSKLVIKHNVTVPIAPSKQEVEQIELPSMTSYKKGLEEFIVSNTTMFGKNVVLAEMVKHLHSHDWWVDVFYPALADEIDKFETVLSKVSDNVNKEAFEYLKDVIINVSADNDASTVRQALYSFLSSKLRLLVAKIVNKQKLDETMFNDETLRTNPLFGIISSITNNKNYDTVIPVLRKMIFSITGFNNLFMQTDDSDIIVKNISLLAYITIQIFIGMLSSTSNFIGVSYTELTKTTDVKTKDNIRITSDIITYCMVSLKSSLENTIIDESRLKQSVEALREQRKQELMAAYKVDDEERELQKRLKKMGLTSWADILTGEDDLVSEEQKAMEQPVAIVKDEYEQEKDYVYDAYKGENDDGDDNEDNEFVSYEAYDN